MIKVRIADIFVGTEDTELTLILDYNLNDDYEAEIVNFTRIAKNLEAEAIYSSSNLKSRDAWTRADIHVSNDALMDVLINLRGEGFVIG